MDRCHGYYSSPASSTLVLAFLSDAVSECNWHLLCPGSKCMQHPLLAAMIVVVVSSIKVCSEPCGRTGSFKRVSLTEHAFASMLPWYVPSHIMTWNWALNHAVSLSTLVEIRAEVPAFFKLLLFSELSTTSIHSPTCRQNQCSVRRPLTMRVNLPGLLLSFTKSERWAKCSLSEVPWLALIPGYPPTICVILNEGDCFSEI